MLTQPHAPSLGILKGECHPPLRGELRYAEPMSRHTSWRVGGPADRFYVPADVDDLVAFIRRLPRAEPVLWVGLGSNLLVREGGIRGAVICTAGVFDRLEITRGHTLWAGCGVACAKAARFAARAGYRGGEFLAGVPGTLGGALAMNAGAYGGQTWDLIRSVETVDREGVRRTRERQEFVPGYRRLSGLQDDEWFLGAELALEPDPERRGMQRIKSLMMRRAAAQPIHQRCCGSVFSNPRGDHAARLIEASGLKGLSVGEARVSEKHANFIVNLGKASATDIEALIEKIQATVESAQAVRLALEVKIVGEAMRSACSEGP
ncbi:MAG: UDP-N-acetylmuramate dehydrogenase [Gammaproteobacteria bacterium]